MILPTKQELDAYDMQPVMDLFNPVPEVAFINEPAGVNHYRLLRWLGGYTITNSVTPMPIFDAADIGAYMGFSAACLAMGGKYVTSYDTDFSHLHLKKEISVRFTKVYHAHSFYSEILNTNLILVDTWHEGKMERDIYDFLVANNWKGVLIYDDIYYNDAMKEFWASLPKPKIDATHIGHLTGTGIIEFI